MQYFIKILITAILVVAISELSKRLTFIGAILASLPLTSILAIVWLYRDTHDTQKIIDLSSNIFWAVLPSLIFFLVLPLFLKNGVHFTASLIYSIVIMFASYSLYAFILQKFGVSL